MNPGIELLRRARGARERHQLPPRELRFEDVAGRMAEALQQAASSGAYDKLTS